MKKQKREVLPTWDLSDLYASKNSPAVIRDLKKAERLATAFEETYKGKLEKLGGDSLAGAVRAYEIIEELTARLSSYASLLYAEDMLNEEHGCFFQDILEHVNRIETRLIFFTLELARIGEGDMIRKLRSRALSRYAPWLKDVRAFRKHQLPETIEKLLHEKDMTSRQAWTRLFDEQLAGLRFPFRGKQLTCTEILDLLSSRKEVERKGAAKSLGATLAANVKIFSMIINILAKDKGTNDSWRRFQNPISSRNLSNFIEDEVVTALIGAVKKSYPDLSHRYYRIKAKWLGKKRLDYWDRNAPLDDSGTRIPWKKAVETVLSSYRDFSPEMAAVGKQFFDRSWIDATPRRGKDSGAFAHPTVPSAHPYLLLNYQGKTRDVMTLAHELGHGVHQVLSARQGMLMADTPLTLAETASIFGEQLTFRRIVDTEKNRRRRQAIIAGKVEDSLNTIVRQVAFCEFERVLHDERRRGEVSTARIGEIWMQTQRESLGNGVRLDKDYANYWAYIPHFIHSPFYVYAYAFGNCLVNALYARYLDGMPDFERKYLAMLEAGGTLRHKELLKPFGLNAADPAFWQKGLDMVGAMIDELG